MGLLTSLITGAPIRAASPAADSDFWYQPVGLSSQAGPRITEEAAMSLSAVYACVSKLAKALEIAPLHLHERLSPDAEGRPSGVRRATERPLYRMLHDQPNARQTAPEFWGAAMAHLALRGTFTAQKIFAGPEVIELDPIHPDLVGVMVLPNRRRGFMIRRKGGTAEPLTQDEVFHVVGLSLDGGRTGVSVIKYAKETLGLARATEDYAARTFSQGALHRGVLSHPGRLTPGAQANLRASILEQTAGPAKWQAPLILEEGIKWDHMTMTPEDTQLLLSRRFSVAEIARWFDVPLVLINETDRSTSWGTGIEQLMQGFVTWGLLPSARRIESAILRDLIPEPARDRFFAKFLLDALLRADTATRFNAYATGIMNGFMAENEARLREDLDPIPGLWDPRRSANQDRGGDPRAPRPAGPAGPPERRRAPVDDEDEEDDAASRAHQIVEATAGRLVAREIAAVTKAAADHAGNPARWQAWVERWYASNAVHVADALAVDPLPARAYCVAHQEALLAEGLAAMERWDQEAPAALVRLALGGGAP